MSELMEQNEVVELTPQRSSELFKWNVAAAALHFVCFIVIFGITDQDKTAPVFTVYANSSGRGESNGSWIPIPEYQGSAIIGFFSAIFMMLCFIDHALMATVFRRFYERYLRRAQNPFRWIEYSVSAAVMRVEIALLSGVLELHLLIAIFGLTTTTMLFGLLQEQFTWTLQGKPKQKSLLPFWLGCIPHVVSWAIICSFFFRGVSSSDGDGGPPDFVWAIIFILGILDATFAVVMYLQQKEISKFADYLFGEKAYIVLSLSAKFLLAWINYGGSNSV